MKTLTKEFGAVVMRQPIAGQFEIDQDLSGQGWEQPFALQGFAINKQYIDLAGMSQEANTLFFSGATIQEPLNPLVFNQVAGDAITVVDVMSQIPLTDAEYLNLFSYGNLIDSGANNLTFDQTIYLRIRSYVVDLDTAAWGSMVLVSDNQMGSLEPTASDRVYCARMFQTGSPITTNRIDLFGARYILQATAKEEPLYEHIMRLRRSYELQQRLDRD